MLRLAVSILVVLGLSACGADRAGGVDADPSSGSVPVSVSLWHCGVTPVTVDGRLWEAAPSQTVDGNADAPLDATNTPADWVGRGTAVVGADRMTYTDEGGEVIDFIPDDGSEPAPCA